jgi:hypothetical protein
MAAVSLRALGHMRSGRVAVHRLHLAFGHVDRSSVSFRARRQDTTAVVGAKENRSCLCLTSFVPEASFPNKAYNYVNMLSQIGHRCYGPGPSIPSRKSDGPDRRWNGRISNLSRWFSSGHNKRQRHRSGKPMGLRPIAWSDFSGTNGRRPKNRTGPALWKCRTEWATACLGHPFPVGPVQLEQAAPQGKCPRAGPFRGTR